MDPESRDQLVEKLAQTRNDLLQFAQTLRKSDWTQPVYSHDEAWTILDLLRHLTWAEGGMARLIRQIRQGQEGVPGDFDLDRYNERGIRKLADKTPAELLEMMSQNRQWILQMLQELDREEWQLQGRHGSLRIMTVAEIFELIATHERRHLDEMRRALERD